MATFLVSYDLRRRAFDYQPLFAALHVIEAKHIQDSVWGVSTKASAKVVFDYLWRHMDRHEDRLFVIPFDKTQNHNAHNSISSLNKV